MTLGLAITIAIAIAIITAIVAIRYVSKTPLLGPLYFYELVRLARRGSQPWLRAAYAILLLIGLLVLYLRTFSNIDPITLLTDSSIQLEQNQRNNFVEWFTFTYFIVQLIFVCLITPVYAGGAIAEEKQSKSLDFLQSSLLSNHEIILGKLAARLTFVVCVSLVGLPVLMLVLLFGGLSPYMIMHGFVLTFFSMLGVAGFSLLMGVYRKNLRDALYWPYGLLIGITAISFPCFCCPIFGFISPFINLVHLFFASSNPAAGGAFGWSEPIAELIVFSLLYFFVFVICTFLAIKGIRLTVLRTRRIPERRRQRRQTQEPAQTNIPEQVTDSPKEALPQQINSSTPAIDSPSEVMPGFNSVKTAPIEAGTVDPSNTVTPKTEDEIVTEFIEEGAAFTVVESPESNTNKEISKLPQLEKQTEKQKDKLDENPKPRRPRRVVSRRSFTVAPLKNKDPFLWKEKYFSGRLPIFESGLAYGCIISALVIFFSIIAMILFVGTFDKLSRGQYPSETINIALRIFVVGSVIALAPTIGIKAAGMISREKQQETLLSLLTIPEARSRILLAKWLTPIYAQKYWLIGLFVGIIVATGFGAVHPFSTVAGVIYLTGFILFANSFGLWLSLRCPTTTRSITLFFTALLFLFIGPPILGTLFRAVIRVFFKDSTGDIAESFFENVNPAYGMAVNFMEWKDFGFNSDPRHSEHKSLVTVFSITVIGFIYMLLAVWFGWRTKKKFEGEIV